MSLEALVIRAEGALVDLDEIERQAFLRLVAEAGNDWPCEKSDFTALVGLPSREQRLAAFIQRNFPPLGAPGDVVALAGVMQRRLTSLVDEMLEVGSFSLRPGVRDLILGAREDGLRVALVSSMSPRELNLVLCGRMGVSRESFDCVAEEPGNSDAAARASAKALALLGLDPARCLAIEGTPAGLRAARACGLKAIVTRSAYTEVHEVADAAFVVGSLPGLLPPSLVYDPEHLGEEARHELVAALSRLNEGIVDLEGSSDRSSAMKVSEILKSKGAEVKSISSGETIWVLSHRLKTDAIGALVVMRADGTIEGIISERDVARGVAEHGSTLPSKTVAELMTKNVITCAPGDSVAGISRVMTQRRIRHLPVVEGGKVVGLISIGDVLGHRLDQMQKEVNVLRDYAIAKS